MAHPKDNELIPLNTVVTINAGFNAGKKARIKKYSFRTEGKGFMHYLGYVQGRGKDLFALFHDDIEIAPTSK